MGCLSLGDTPSLGAQVDNFLEWADPDAQTLVALDFEATAGNQMTIDQAREFLRLVGEKLGRKPVIYGGNLLKESLKGHKDAFLGAHRLWLAQYGDHPKVQASWDQFWLWQYTDGTDGPNPAVVPGIPDRKVPGIPGNSEGHLDCDHYLGTEAKLAAEWAS